MGQGLSGAEAVKQVGMTVEGYTNTKNAYEMGRRMGVEMPTLTRCTMCCMKDMDTSGLQT